MGKKSILQSRHFRSFRENGLLTICVLWVILFIYGSLRVSYFFKPSFWMGIFKTYTPCALMSIGLAALMISGGSDMSCGSTASLCCVIIVYCRRVFGFSVPLSLLMGVLTGLMCGIVKGTIATYMRVTPLLMTYAFSQIAQGLGRWLVPNAVSIGSALELSKLYGSRIIGIPFPLWMTIFCVLIWVVIKNTYLGNHFYAMGNDGLRAFATGVQFNKTRMLANIFCGLMTGVAGIAVSGVTATAQYNYAAPLNIQAIASCVVGGVFIGGGEGTVLGAVLGSYFFGVLSSTVLARVTNMDYQALISNLLVFLCIMIPSGIKILRRKRM